MLPNLKYSMDTSAILESYVRRYPPDVFPSVWERLDMLANDELIVASGEVLVELERQDDEVCQWLQERPHMVREVDHEVQPIVRQILEDHPRLVNVQKNRSRADVFVIALAHLEKCAVVSFENPSNNMSKPKIPDVCNAIGVPHLSLVEMFREEEISL